MKYKIKITRVCRVEYEDWAEVEADSLAEAEDKANELDLSERDWTEVNTDTQNIEVKVWPV